MKKCLLLACFCLACATMSASGVAVFAEGEALAEQVRIEVRQNMLKVNGAEGGVVEIFDIAGNKVATYDVDSEVETIELNLSKGFYIIKVGKTVRKVHLS